MREPLESERERTVAPSSISLRAVCWATLPEPEIATRVDGLFRLYSGQALATIWVKKTFILKKRKSTKKKKKKNLRARRNRQDRNQ